MLRILTSFSVTSGLSRARIGATLFSALLFVSATGHSASLQVIDGDQVLLNGEPARLADIDAPELCQPGGQAARRVLRKMLRGDVTYEWEGVDAGGNRLVRLYVDGREVNQNMVQLGWAWDTVRERPSRYAFAQAVARLEHQGLWAGDQPLPPWEWRDNAENAERPLCSLSAGGRTINLETAAR
ncbi:MAG: thermonuclease family protein [Chromatiaceae bacterium]|nr:thermonuclease family protein [Chromatiaceae bacterium]